VVAVEWGRTTIDDLEQAFTGASPILDRLVGVLINKSPGRSITPN
jgi:hypothetical protein